MSETVWLIRRARTYLVNGERIPVDLFYSMLAAGIDVSAVERKYTQKED